MIMETPIRKYQKQKEYQRHKVLRRMKKRQQRKAEQMQKIAEKQLKRKLPKMDGGIEPKIEYVDQVRINPITGEALMSDNTTGSVILPEISVRPEPKLTKSAFDGYTQYLDDLASFVPIAGDVNDAINAGIAVNNGDYLQAGMLGAGLLLPNILQKPLSGAVKYGMRHMNRSFVDRLRNQFDALVDLEQSIKNKSYNNDGTEFMQNYVKDNSLAIDGFPKANYSKYKSPDGSKLNVYINSGGYGSILTNGNRPHTVIETAALKGLPGTGLTYNSHMQYGLTPTEKMQYFRALNSMPNGVYIGEGFNPTLGQLAIDTYRKTGSRFGAYKQIWKGGKQIRMNSRFDAPYSADSYKLVLKQANRPGYELRYTDVPSWGFNNVGEFDPLTRFGDVDLDAKHLDKVNEYILNANPNARTAYIKDGKLMLPVPILKRSYNAGKD